MAIGQVGGVGRLGLAPSKGVGVAFAFTFVGVAFSFAGINFEWRP